MIEKLRSAQFFKRADEEAGLPAEPAARLFWLATPLLVFTGPVR
ncbi:hypothetical protein [Polyangium mundeleinium]|uniref:Uncharacterized protein n=1 Tax=Polyangium mundeleinium TaxID=2995306 RepID=A0ABT5EUB1_9BACT|nr:hypothetical protein [Polyangium mundeleinium]MDC0744507.1 hypothetical protein [Polyangium mundeleinium]